MIPQPQVQRGLRRHSSGGSVQTFGKTSSLRAVWERNGVPRGAAVSIQGWTEPGLMGRQTGESPACPGGGRGGRVGPAPPALPGGGGVSSSPPHRRRAGEGTETLTWPLTPSRFESAPGLLGVREQPRDAQPRGFLRLQPPPAQSPSRLDKSFPHPDKSFPRTQEPRESASSPTARQRPCRSRTRPPLQKSALQRAERFSKVTQADDKKIPRSC